MMNITGLLRRSSAQLRFGLALVLGLAMVAAGMSDPGTGDGTAAAQASGPCALLTDDEIQSLAPNTTSADGVPRSVQAVGFAACRYAWGEGTERFILDVTVNDASRMFAGASAELIKQGLQASVTAGTTDAVIPDVGEVAVFKADSALYVHATAYSKGRVLQVVLEGFEAREKKDQVISLLTSAASRL